jgi:DNA-binding HxlR family transcriptional regulator
MQTGKVYEWINEEESRRKILLSIKQPLTGRQIGKRTGIAADTCSYVIVKLSARGLLSCINPNARNSRLYWLTDAGIQCCRKLYRDSGLLYKEYDLPCIDWSLYGWICFSHRSIVIRTLAEPMQPSEIKRAIRKKSSNMKISANNIRDIIRLLLKKGVVKKVFYRKKAHPRYELTESGKQLRDILIRSETVF